MNVNYLHYIGLPIVSRCK